jgi:hypothetical protein
MVIVDIALWLQRNLFAQNTNILLHVALAFQEQLNPEIVFQIPG